MPLTEKRMDFGRNPFKDDLKSKFLQQNAINVSSKHYRVEMDNTTLGLVLKENPGESSV